MASSIGLREVAYFDCPGGGQRERGARPRPEPSRWELPECLQNPESEGWNSARLRCAMSLVFFSSVSISMTSASAACGNRVALRSR